MRNVDYNERKRKVLSATIDAYIKNADPISSEGLSADFECSSATIRNILAELEEEGYLTHPYTSSGRVPTDKGYRYYVDFLLNQIALLEDEKGYLSKELKKEKRKLEDTLEHTSKLISASAKNASIVSFLDWDDKIFFDGTSFVLDQPEFEDLRRTRKLVKLFLEDKQKLIELVNRNAGDNIKIYIGAELCYPEVEDCSLIVSSYKSHENTKGRIAVLGPKRMEYARYISLLDYFSLLLGELVEEY
jgi:transcriptional regulator of heat shock response